MRFVFYRRATRSQSLNEPARHPRYSSDMKFIILVGLLSVLVVYSNAIPLQSEPSVSAQSSESESSSNESSNESVYEIKEVSYEIGSVDTLDLGNSTQIVVVNPEDRIETEEVALWTSANGSALENYNTTNAAPTETALPTTEASTRPQEVNKDTVTSSSEVLSKSSPSLNAIEQTNKETTSMTTDTVRK